MSNRKNPQADLERRRPVFFQAGFIIALCVVLLAIEWTSVSWMPSTIAAPITEDFILEAEIVPNRVKPKKQQRPKPDRITPVITPEPTPEPSPEPDPDPFPDPDLNDIEPYFGDNGGMNDEDEPMIPFMTVEIMPHFADCENKADREAQKRCTDQRILKELGKTKYPAMVRDIGLEGTVYASFVVGSNGAVQSIEIKRGVHPLLDSAVVRQIRALPDFVPGRQQGKSVPVIMQVPVNFKLR